MRAEKHGLYTFHCMRRLRIHPDKAGQSQGLNDLRSLRFGQYITHLDRERKPQCQSAPEVLVPHDKRSDMKPKGPDDTFGTSCGTLCCQGATSRLQLSSFMSCSSILRGAGQRASLLIRTQEMTWELSHDYLPAAPYEPSILSCPGGSQASSPDSASFWFKPLPKQSTWIQAKSPGHPGGNWSQQVHDTQ